jgi:hypothetical protein
MPFSEAVKLVLAEQFKKYDKDNSGFIDMNENIAMDKKLADFMKVDFNEEETRKTFALLDTYNVRLGAPKYMRAHIRTYMYVYLCYVYVRCARTHTAAG